MGEADGMGFGLRNWQWGALALLASLGGLMIPAAKIVVAFGRSRAAGFEALAVVLVTASAIAVTLGTLVLIASLVQLRMVRRLERRYPHDLVLWVQPGSDYNTALTKLDPAFQPVGHPPFHGLVVRDGGGIEVWQKRGFPDLTRVATIPMDSVEGVRVGESVELGVRRDVVWLDLARMLPPLALYVWGVSVGLRPLRRNQLGTVAKTLATRLTVGRRP